MNNNQILITGGSSMVGKHLQSILPEAVYLSSKDCDLENYEKTFELIKKIKPQRVIHLAAKVGGIMDNINNPVDFFEKNIYINTNILKACFQNNVLNFTGILSTCIYPDKVADDQYPMKENLLHEGPPTPTNFSYGYAKRCLAVQCQTYNKQYGTNYSNLIPCNLYSEYDHFEGDKAHFLSSLIKKISDAKNKNSDHIQLMGTGSPLRQFMYAEDLARAIEITVRENKPFLYNICNNENLSIKEMAEIGLKSCDASEIEIKWDDSKPDGQHRKDADASIFIEKYPKFKFTKLKDGIKKVYNLKFLNEKS